MEATKLYIIWDPKDGAPRTEAGEFISDGIIGRVGIDNAYIKIYPSYFDNEPRRPADLEVGESVTATFSLSGEMGRYQIWRVR